MPRADAPQDVIDLAEARSAARRAHDWATADDLKARIEAAGWKVVDAASLYTLERAAPPDVEEDGVVRYGSSASVPSRLDEAPVGVASVVLVATDWPDDLARAVRALVEHSPDGTQLIVVANAPSGDQGAALLALDAVDPGAPGVATEVVWTRTRLGHAAALNAGIRRAAAPVVVIIDAAVEPLGDIVTALAAALEDETVAAAGPFGLVSSDLRVFGPPATDAVDVDVIEGYALAFRRADFASRGPLDEHFAFYRNLDVWWSLVLRDPYADLPEADDDAALDLSRIPPPRRAVRVTSVPVTRHELRAWTALPEEERERRSKKNFYRVLKRFATRRDLLVTPAAGGTPDETRMTGP
jgi:cysteinyl-tRNA synthetase